MDVHILLNTTRSHIPRWPWPQGSQVHFMNPQFTKILNHTQKRLYHKLARRARGPGVVYLTKAFLPWMFPRARRAVVLDFDLVFNGPIDLLWAEFDKFSESNIIGLAQEFSRDIYANFTHGVNGGVQLLHLERMRNGRYEQMLHQLASSQSPGNPVGYLGDQTLYTSIAEIWPETLFRLSCKFNYQLNNRRAARNYRCNDGCIVMHGNDPSWKTLFQSMTKTSNWQPQLRKELLLRRYNRAADQCITSRAIRGTLKDGDSRGRR